MSQAWRKQKFIGIYIEASGNDASDAPPISEYVACINTVNNGNAIILLPVARGSIYFVINDSKDKVHLFNQPGNLINGTDYSSSEYTFSGDTFILWGVDDTNWVGLLGAALV
jgi:hypothetical protein